jgi:hypothetical protein
MEVAREKKKMFSMGLRKLATKIEVTIWEHGMRSYFLRTLFAQQFDQA